MTSVSTREIGLAWNSNDSLSFEIHITPHEAGKPRIITTIEQSIVIGDLYPGTKYHFDIYPQGPNGTKGDSQTVSTTTGKQIGCIFCELVMFLKGNQYKPYMSKFPNIVLLLIILDNFRPFKKLLMTAMHIHYLKYR